MASIDTARPRGRAIAAAALGLALLPASARAEDRAGPMEQHRGGTMKLMARGSAGTIDQQINDTVQFGQLLWATDDGLLTFRKVGGESSNQAVAAYPAPSDVLGVLFDCSAFHPGSDSSANTSGFCEPETDAQMKRASTRALTDAAASDQTWAAVDRAVTDAAPGANMFQPKEVDVVSKRVGRFIISNQAQLLLQQAWVR